METNGVPASDFIMTTDYQMPLLVLVRSISIQFGQKQEVMPARREPNGHAAGTATQPLTRKDAAQVPKTAGRPRAAVHVRPHRHYSNPAELQQRLDDLGQALSEAGC